MNMNSSTKLLKRNKSAASRISCGVNKKMEKYVSSLTGDHAVDVTGLHTKMLMSDD
jgi:hypothetical protein